MVTFKNDDIDDFKTSGNDVVEFKLVTNLEEFENDSLAFKPDMTHQIFGENETVFGYSGLKVKVYYGACSLKPYFNMSYDKVVPDSFGTKPQDILKLFREVVELPNIVCDKAGFISSLDKEKDVMPLGEKVMEHKSGNDLFEVYATDFQKPGVEKFHEYLQTFLLFYVDGASYIDTEDDKWKVFFAYKVEKTGDGHMLYKIAGYQTVYQYWSYWDCKRPRISQALVLPPYQRKGVATMLIQAFYDSIKSDVKVRDYTVEDPSENFQSVRDVFDCKLVIDSGIAASILYEKWTADIANQLQKELKLNKKQSRRVLEILQLLLAISENQKKAFRLAVKSRLFAPFKRKPEEIKKLEKCLTSKEGSIAKMAALSALQNEENVRNQLGSLFDEVLEQYTPICEKLRRDAYDVKLRTAMKTKVDGKMELSEAVNDESVHNGNGEKTETLVQVEVQR